MKMIISFLLLLFLYTNCHAQQIFGQNPAMLGTTNVYSYIDATIIMPVWSVTSNGQIISTTRNGATCQATIKWTAVGQGVITMADGSTIKRTLTVTIQSTPLPPAYQGEFSRCGPGTLALTATPHPSGNSIKWYTTETGGSGTIGLTFMTPNLPASTSFWISTYNTTNGLESTTRTRVDAIIKTLPPAPTITFDKRMGPGLLVLSASGGANYKWFSPQGTLLKTATTYTTPSIDASISKYIYATTVSTNGCESSGPTWVNITIDPNPKPTTANNRSILGSLVKYDAGAGYSSYQWKNAKGVVVGSARTFQTNISGHYTVTTEKSGYYGVGVSDPVPVHSQLEAQQMNCVVHNKLLFPTKNESRIELLSVDSILQKVQYFDGLGRPVQTIETQASPLRKDIVAANGFDVFGREIKKFLPYVDGANGQYKADALKTTSNTDELTQYRSGKQYAFYQLGGDVVTDQYPYTEIILEPSSLARPLQQGAPGQTWQPNPSSTYQSPVSSSRAVLFRYEFNTANEVLLWKPVTSAISAFPLVHAGTASAPVYYAPNMLYKNRTKDENRNEVITYTDFAGRIILKRVQIVAGTNIAINDTNFASTYYVYDSFGQLICVLPPEAVKNISTAYHHAAATDATKNAFLDRWAFRYKYDDRFRMVQKKNPGAKPVYMVYDTRNRVVLTQDGNQRSVPGREWTFTKFDAFNRVIANGNVLVPDSLGVIQAREDVSTAQKYETYVGTGSFHGYTNQSFPTTATAADYHTVTYYDKYDATIVPSGYQYVNESLPGQESSAFGSVVGAVTGTLAKDLSSNVMLRAVTYYDYKKRIIQNITQNHRGGTIRASTVYDFPGKVLLTHKTYVVNNVTTKVKERRAYDHTGRLLTQRHSINDAAEVVIHSNTYNELGQLIDKKLHSTNGNTFLQSQDYRYHIRGWLSKINEPDVSTVAPGDASADYYGMELLYQDAVSGVTTVKQYNGNISAMRWSRGGTPGSSVQCYAFKYDPSGRLSGASHYDHELNITTGLRSWKTNSNQFGESLTYDHNGNIKTLTRRGVSGQLIDNLTYGYAGNMLLYVNDAGNATTGFINGNTTTDDYSYDYNGNLDKDKNKGLSNKGSITYNFLNLPVEITKGSEKVRYIYDATGKKLSQEVYNGSGVLSKITDYVGEMILEGTTTATSLKMIQHPEGRVLPNGSGWEYQYHMKDHLGNVRLSFTSKAQTAKTFTTNFEAATNNNFLNYSNHTFDLVDHTDAGTVYQKTQKLAGVNRVGLAKTFAVMPGDQITVSAYAKYMNLGTTANTAAFISSLASAFGASSTSTGEGAKIYSGLVNYAALVEGGHEGDDDGGMPKAFVTILFFDKNYKLIDAAWDQLSGGEQTGSTKQPHDLMTVTAKAPDGGYAYVFLSNEHPSMVEVFFDDVTMKHLPSAIFSVDDYYPFGLTYNSYQRENSVKNKRLYNDGAEREDALDLNVDGTLYRVYDPAGSRWWQIDPKADVSYDRTPYNYAFNNPVRYNDPKGDCPPGVPCVNPLGHMQIRQNRASNLGPGYVRSNGQQQHHGHDLRAAVGTNVSSTMAGTVVSSYYSQSYGNTVVVKTNIHPEAQTNFIGPPRPGGAPEQFIYVQYSHLTQRNVAVGDAVTMGQNIGTSGQTGNAAGQSAAEAHLHIQVGTELNTAGSIVGNSTVSPNLVYDGVSFASADLTANQTFTSVIKTITNTDGQEQRVFQQVGNQDSSGDYALLPEVEVSTDD